MSKELLAIIEQIEREKGIKKDVLILAVESALLSAVKRVIDVKPNEELSVKLDPKDGTISAFKDNEEITSVDFGRIAASAARQVIIQKIREAEKDVIFGEFQGKIGEIVSGTVYRFEKGNIVVDMLGKSEAILPKSEQCKKDEFKQGQRIRALILEVRKEPKGAQIILTRKHSNFIKKLFELEVPEIYEGIVEIRGISREPGERTKIAVCSKDDKVDGVGACVGMRGGRVRNISNELSGERIDVVRYSEDIREYIKSALSLSEVSEMKVDKANKRVQVVVNDDQLALAIGKHGQNVRLASKLLGWELDVRTKATAASEAAQKLEGLVNNEAVQSQEQSAVKSDEPLAVEVANEIVEGTPLEKLAGVGEKTLENLKSAGFKTVESIANTTIAKLTEVKGIGEKKAENLINESKKIIEG